MASDSVEAEAHDRSPVDDGRPPARSGPVSLAELGDPPGASAHDLFADQRRRHPTEGPHTFPAPEPATADPGADGTLPPLAPTGAPVQGRGQPTFISRTRMGDGLLVAAAAAVLCGATWWAVVALTERQFPYLAVLLGAAVGQAALVGGRRGSLGLGVTAALLALASLTAAQYFIARSLAISQLGAAGVPLWDGTSVFFDAIRHMFEDNPLTAVFVVVAAIVAGASAGRAGARASGRLGELRARPPRSPLR